MSKQQQIIKAFEENKELILTKREIKEKTGITYYHNADKQLGEVLSRMVKDGSLIRLNRGYFKLGNT